MMFRCSRQEQVSFILWSNGSNCVVPALQSCHAEVKKSQDTLIDNLKDGIDLSKNILKMTPHSNFRKAFKYTGET